MQHFYNLPLVEVQQLCRNIPVGVNDIHENNVTMDTTLLPQRGVFRAEAPCVISESSRARAKAL